MFFSVIKTILWIVAIVVLFPVNEAQNYKQFTNNTQGHLTPEHLYALTKETVDDVDTFCTRNAATCNNFKGMITEFGGKIRYIGDSIFEWARNVGGNEGGPEAITAGEQASSNELKTPEKSRYYEFDDTLEHRKTSRVYTAPDLHNYLNTQNQYALNDNDIVTASIGKVKTHKDQLISHLVLATTLADKNDNTIIVHDTLTQDDKEFPWQSING